MRNSFDVIVIGGGCLGAAIAISLARKAAGKRVALIEKAGLWRA